MRLIALIGMLVIVKASRRPEFDKEVSKRLEHCDQVLWVPELKKPVISSIPITNQTKTICVTSPDGPSHTMAVISFTPTACVYYREDLFLEESVAGINIFRSKVYRDGCVGSRTRREQSKHNSSIDSQRFLVVVKKALYIAPGVAIDDNVPTLLCLIVILTTFSYAIVTRLMYRSDWVLFISGDHPQQPRPAEQKKFN